jgi:DnaK suppressor protein
MIFGKRKAVNGIITAMNDDMGMYRVRIAERLAELDREDALGANGQSVVTLDQQSVGRLSRMDALQSQALAQGMQARRDAERRALAQALERLNSGEYGWCEECGDAIAPARLRFDPAARLCISCASG